MPSVSVITINYNNYLDTIECLESLLRINYHPYQVIIIDNGSSNDSFIRLKCWFEGREEFDLSRSRLKEMISPLLPKPIPYNSFLFDGEGFLEEESRGTGSGQPAILIRSWKNLGFSGGNNLGIKFALERYSPQYFWFLNNDTVVDREVLAELVRTAEGNQRVGVVGSKILHYYDIGTIQYLGYGRVKLNYAVFPYQGQADFSLNDCRVKGYITGASFLINKDIVAKVGLWDEKFFMSAEDLEYSYRIHKSGYLLYVSPRSRIFHKDGASTGRQTTVRYFLWRKTLRTAFNSFYIAGYYDMRNWIYFYRKHKGIFFLIFYYSVFLPFFFLAVCFFILIFDDHKRERIWHVSDAFKDGLRGVMGVRRS